MVRCNHSSTVPLFAGVDCPTHALNHISLSKLSLVYLLEDGLVLVRWDDHRIVEDLLDDFDTKDNKKNEADIVSAVQQLPVAEPFSKPATEECKSHVPGIRTTQPEDPYHEHNLPSTSRDLQDQLCDSYNMHLDLDLKYEADLL